MLIPHPFPLPRGEGEAENIGLISGCLWSLSQTPFSLPKKAHGNEFKKTLLLTRKPESDLWDKGAR
ncbi:MAG: hypothetical protein DCC56_08870 [Anaerolineae bacterium]|nr:MAG: hypothetical protein DCC56_08870 [Anaerolineae bacterium]